ncbi:MAG: hypothetical protein JST22_19300 [Bacteroidetes bacterium]|nr:hypothetical protein [Bacteroidota bacterium]
MTTTGHAAQELRYAEADCGNGRRWWSVTTYEYGQPCEIVGVNCDGAQYHRDIFPCEIVVEDPTGGLHTVEGVDSMGNVIWYARVLYDANHEVQWIGGRNANGQFYTWRTPDAPGPGGLN